MKEYSQLELDSISKLYGAVFSYYKLFGFTGTNNKEPHFRLSLMIEELGEIAKVVTKGKGDEEFIKGNIDLLLLMIGNFVSLKTGDHLTEIIARAAAAKVNKIKNKCRKVKLEDGNERIMHDED